MVLFLMCGRRESNPYASRHQILSLACLPISTRPLILGLQMYNNFSDLQTLFYWSSGSSSKMSFTDLLNRAEIFKARTVEGLNLPFSIALMVCLLTASLSARSCWVMSSRALSTFILFFISHPPLVCPYNKLKKDKIHYHYDSKITHPVIDY